MKIKILLIIFSLLISIILSEAVLRVISMFVRNHRPVFLEEIFNRGDFRILCVGDSVTFGLGDKTGKGYPKNLENILNKKLIQKVGVFNKAVPGSSTAGALKQLQEGMETIPKISLVIILTGGGNSYWNFKEMYASIINQPLTVKDRLFLKLDNYLSNFRLYLVLKMSLENIKNEKRKKVNGVCQECVDKAGRLRDVSLYPDSCEPSHFNEVISQYKRCLVASLYCEDAYLGILDMYSACNKDINSEIKGFLSELPKAEKLFDRLHNNKLRNLILKAMQEHIKTMVSLCKDRRVKVLILNYPSGEINFLGDLINVGKIERLDLHNYFKNELGCDKCQKYFVDDIHLNSQGYYLMAERVAGKILEMLSIK